MNYLVYQSAVSGRYQSVHILAALIPFLVGNVEPLLDDSLFMAAKWSNAGNETESHIMDGACHAFTLIPMGDTTEEGLGSLISFVKIYIK